MTARPRLDAEVPPWALEILAEVRTIRVDQAQILAELVRRRSQRDDQAVAALLVEIHAAANGLPFAVWELLDHAQAPGAERLRAAIGAAAGGLDARRLGKFLKRHAGEEHAGLRVARLGEDRQGARWSVRECGSEPR